MGKIEKEKSTVARMIHLYCMLNHKTDLLCDECRELTDYARRRLDKCVWGEKKPVCKRCSVHCYKPEKRIQIRKIMRFSGPRMLFYYPAEFMRHWFK